MRDHDGYREQIRIYTSGRQTMDATGLYKPMKDVLGRDSRRGAAKKL